MADESFVVGGKTNFESIATNFYHKYKFLFKQNATRAPFPSVKEVCFEGLKYFLRTCKLERDFLHYFVVKVDLII